MGCSSPSAGYHISIMSDISPASNSESETAVTHLQERVVSLEMHIMHLQQESETLGQVILDQQKQLDLFREQLDKLGVRIEEALVAPEERDPAMERPPHY